MDSSFDLIAQELQKQHDIMEEMIAENRRLRQELADLRAGKGIFVDINGLRIELQTLSTTSQLDAPTSTSSSQPLPMIEESTLSTEDAPQAQIDTVEDQSQEHLVRTPTSALTETQTPSDPEKKELHPTFLEEIMLDEFEAALTMPMQQASIEEEPKRSQEEQQAELRRELMGSYLLE
jgi:hypothetical protein